MISCPMCKAEFEIPFEEREHARRLLRDVQQYTTTLETLINELRRLEFATSQVGIVRARIIESFEERG